MARKPSENRITDARYDQVMFSRVCPGCGDHLVIDVPRFSKRDALDRGPAKYQGTYHCCAGESGDGNPQCWHMTKRTSAKRPLYETFGPEATRERL